MRVGKLRKLVSIQEPLALPATSSGYVASEWRTWATVAARVEEQDGTETQAADALSAVRPVSIVIRYMVRRPAPKEKLVMDGRVFNIASIREPTGHLRELHLVCHEEVS